MLHPLFARIWRTRQRGQGLVEYSLIIALVAIVVIANLVLMGPRLAPSSARLPMAYSAHRVLTEALIARKARRGARHCSPHQGRGGRVPPGMGEQRTPRSGCKNAQPGPPPASGGTLALSLTL